MINLVLRNLISNAIKFTPENGQIKIISTAQAGGCKIAICDTGVGMNAETLEKINQNSYYTTTGTSNESGTGLGLMLCKEFLSLNGSKLHVSSQQGEGSVFSFIIPANGALNP
jgi:two-component system, sensor histidine kinase and response regulator